MHGVKALYAKRMHIQLRHLRCLAAVAETGTFTDAAIELGLSQASVSRAIAGFEESLGHRLIDRVSRPLTLTPAGVHALGSALKVFAILEELKEYAATGSTTIRVGYAWSALGRHTIEFQRRWAAEHPDTTLQLVRVNVPHAGLDEEVVDLSVLRRLPDATAYKCARIGSEKRYCVMASDDALAARRSVTLSQISDKPVVTNPRTGITTLELWPASKRPPAAIPTVDVDDWLTIVGEGRARGVTSEATFHQYRRTGLVYRLIRDAPPIEIHAAWPLKNAHAHQGAVVTLLRELYSG